MGVADVGGSGRQCVLDGCEQEIEDVVGRPQRRYCSPAHRLAARQARRQSTRERSVPDTAPRAGADQGRRPVCGNESGWAALNEAALAIRAAYAEQQWRAAAGPPTGAGHAAPAAPTSSPADPIPAAAAAPHPERPGELPEWARHAGLVSDLHRTGFWPGWSARFLTAPGRLRPPGPPGRRRTAAVLGAAGIVAGGYALAAVPTVTAGPDELVPVQAPPAPTVEESFVTRAQATMSSFDQQLEVIARTERQWREQRPAEPPPAVLDRRRALLTERRVVLAAQLDTVRALAGARAELTRSEQQLQATASDPTAPPEQRAQRERDRDTRRRALDVLAADTDTALRTQLPTDDRRTTEITDQVLADIRSGVRPDPPPADPTTLAAPGDRTGGALGDRADRSRERPAPAPPVSPPGATAPSGAATPPAPTGVPTAPDRGGVRPPPETGVGVPVPVPSAPIGVPTAPDRGGVGPSSETGVGVPVPVPSAPTGVPTAPGPGGVGPSSETGAGVPVPVPSAPTGVPTAPDRGGVGPSSETGAGVPVPAPAPRVPVGEPGAATDTRVPTTPNGPTRPPAASAPPDRPAGARPDRPRPPHPSGPDADRGNRPDKTSTGAKSSTGAKTSTGAKPERAEPRAHRSSTRGSDRRDDRPRRTDQHGSAEHRAHRTDASDHSPRRSARHCEARSGRSQHRSSSDDRSGSDRSEAHHHRDQPETKRSRLARAGHSGRPPRSHRHDDHERSDDHSERSDTRSG